MTFHFLDNVFLLYLALKTTKRVFEGFALLKSDFSQSDYTPLLALKGPFCYDNLVYLSQAECAETSVLVSKQESQAELHEPWSIRACGLEKVCRLLIIRWI